MKRAIGIVFSVALSLLPVGLQAQGYPSKPIKLLVPYSPGGTTDIMARALQEPMQKSLGQPLVVENRPGGAGSIAMREAARSTPNGYTLVFMNNGLVATTPVLVKDAGYDGIKDFSPVGTVSTAAMFLVVNPGVPASDLKSFIAYARGNPGKLEYATAGSGSFGHLSSELFLREAGIKMLHVPYKGQAPSVNAVMTGEVKVLITSPSASMTSLVASGKLKLLAVGSMEPWPLAPGAPTVASALPGYKAESWFGLLAPAGTPARVIAKLNDALGQALAQPSIQKQFNNFGLIAKSSTPEQMRGMIAREVKLWGDVIRETGIEAQ